MRKAIFVISGILLLTAAGGWFFLSQNMEGRRNSQVASTAPFKAEGWHSFLGKDPAFKVMLPLLPHHAEKKIHDPKTDSNRDYDMYIAERRDGTVFMITVISFEKKLPELPASLPEEIVQELLRANPKSQLEKLTVGSHHHNPMVDFHIVQDQTKTMGRALLSEDTLFILSLAGNQSQLSEQEFNYFINSFDLLDLSNTVKKAENSSGGKSP